MKRSSIYRKYNTIFACGCNSTWFIFLDEDKH